MRSPSLSLADARRVLVKGYGLLSGLRSNDAPLGGRAERHTSVVGIKPKVLPFHLNRVAQSFNMRSLARDIESRMRNHSITDPVLLTSLPVVAPYVDAIPHSRLAYLRLDDYARLPGCDPRLVEITERQMIAQADVVFGTARALVPAGLPTGKARYLPQGVDWDRFAATPVEPSRKRVLGFFGLIAEWMDFGLIEAVAGLVPDWQLEFIGPVRHLPSSVQRIPNVRFLPSVAYAELPTVLGDWAAAWIPFEVSELTRGVNPLKAREYLAAGLPTHCTALPEVAALDEAFISNSAEEIVAWLEKTLREDSPSLRKARRQSVRGDSWQERAREMRTAVQG